MIRTLALVLVMLVIAVPMLATGPAGTPCAATSTVFPVLVSPGGTFVYQVIVRDEAENPVAGAIVNIQFQNMIGPHLWCDGSLSVPASSPPNVSNGLCGATGADGVARFTLFGGSNAAVPSAANYVTIVAGGVTLTTPGGIAVVSTDAVTSGGAGFPDGLADLSDIQFLTPLFAAAPSYSWSADFNGDGKVGLADGVMTIYDLQTAVLCAGNTNVCIP